MKPCCEKKENREVDTEREDLRITICKVCGCRHFELSVDPVELGLRLS